MQSRALRAKGAIRFEIRKSPDGAERSSAFSRLVSEDASGAKNFVLHQPRWALRRRKTVRDYGFRDLACLICTIGAVAAVALPKVPLSNFGGAQVQSSPAGERRDKIENLLATIRDPKLRQSDPERVVAAIQALGRMKAVEAVDDLAKLLAFRRTFPWETGRGPIQEFHIETPASRYPAVGALMEIGEPSLPAMIRVIKSYELTSLESRNAMEVVSYLFRGRRQAAIDFLRAAGEHTATPKEAQRLLDAGDKLPLR